MTSENDPTPNISQILRDIPEADGDIFLNLGRRIQTKQEGAELKGYTERIEQLLTLVPLLESRNSGTEIYAPYCGLDTSAVPLAEALGGTQANVLHVDLDEDIVSTLQSRGYNSRVENSTKPPIEDKKYDIIYFTNPDWYWNSPDAIKGYGQRLKEGGLIIANAAHIATESPRFKLIGTTFFDKDTRLADYTTSEGEKDLRNPAERDCRLYVYEYIGEEKS